MSAEHTIELFSKVSDNQELKAGETIFKEGETGTVMFGIVSGSVAMQVDGNTVEIIKAGDVFGEGALVHPDGLRRSTAIAQSDCQLVAIDVERFKFLIENTPTFAIDVMRSYSNRLQHFKHPKFG
ncbi:MAG: Crp/Fnr family transcriptional regulator [Leptolyngbyaceae cyanobacterium]